MATEEARHEGNHSVSTNIRTHAMNAAMILSSGAGLCVYACAFVLSAAARTTRSPDKAKEGGPTAYLIWMLVIILSGFIVSGLLSSETFTTAFLSSEAAFLFARIPLFLARYAATLVSSILLLVFLGMKGKERIATTALLATLATASLSLRFLSFADKSIWVEYTLLVPAIALATVWKSAAFLAGGKAGGGKTEDRDKSLYYFVNPRFAVCTAIHAAAFLSSNFLRILAQTERPLVLMPDEIGILLPGLSICLSAASRIGTTVSFDNREPSARTSRYETALEKFSLSPREREIAILLSGGKTNKEIALFLGLSYGTVKNHISSLYSKLGIGSRYEFNKFL